MGALLHVENYTEKEYLDFIEVAVNDKTSYNRSSFYNFMLNIFVEADESCGGRVDRAQFDKLLSRAAQVPPFRFGTAGCGPGNPRQDVRLDGIAPWRQGNWVRDFP